MINLRKETKKDPQKIIDMAREYFGKEGLGLEVKNLGKNCLLSEGGGGYVQVTACKDNGLTLVDVEAREYDYHAKKFLDKV